MSRWIVFAGITAMLVTGYFATFDVRGQGFLRSVKHVPAELQTKVETSLRAGGMNWARVEMDGQRAILSGLAGFVGMLISDLLLATLDPRIRFGKRG